MGVGARKGFDLFFLLFLRTVSVYLKSMGTGGEREIETTGEIENN